MQIRANLVGGFQLIVPLSLLIAVVVVHAWPQASTFWGGRSASYFVDPNTLGGYAIILGFMCLFMINAEGNDPWWFKLVKYAGFLAGIYLSIGSGTR